VAETKPSREVEPEGTAKTEPSVAAAQEPAPPPAVEPPTPPTPVPPSVPPMASAAETAPTGPTASAAKDTPAPAARPDAPTWSGKDAKTLTKEALVALEQGRFREAARLARHATELNPGDADSWLTLGAAYDSLGYKAPAQGAFKSCVHNSRGARVEECRRLIVPE
jgi:hypothetical protein